MALLLSKSLTSLSNSQFQNPNLNFPSLCHKNHSFIHHTTFKSFTLTVSNVSDRRNLTPGVPPPRTEALQLSYKLLHFTASTILFISLGCARVSAAVSGDVRCREAPPVLCQTVHEETIGAGDEGVVPNSVNMENPVKGDGNEESIEDKELKAALESWKAKTFALTVPLRIIALRGSIPPSWIKEFVQLQGRRLKLQTEFRGSLNDVFSDLSATFSKGKVEPKSAMAADIVSIGDSWLNYGINKKIIEPIQGVEGLDWFKGLSEKWKVYLRRNSDGEIDPGGELWAAPYRWGSMVIAYKTNIFRKRNISPIEDWDDLWRPELAGKISMVDSPREVVGAVLKYMGASYNTKDIDSQIIGGKKAVVENLALLQKQVRLFDSVHYLKAFAVQDVWVTVGWSSDILPAAKRMSNVTVIVPKSGASLWADLWAIPAASKIATDRIGRRVRGPSPLIHQWIEFCLQAARALPFKQEVIPGSSPFSLEDPLPADVSQGLMMKGKPKMDTNLIAGVPPPDILAKCEFLEPLSESTLTDYHWIISNTQKPSCYSLIRSVQRYIASLVQNFRLKQQSV